MNIFAIGLGIFLFFVLNDANDNSSILNLFGFTAAISLILAGVAASTTFIKRKLPKSPFYLSLVSLLSFSLLFLYLVLIEHVADATFTLFYFINAALVAALIYKHRPRKLTAINNTWSWREGKVDRRAPHIELRYGSVETGAYDDWLPIAYISAPNNRSFTVQFIIAPSNEQNNIAITSAKKQLDFYLIDKNEPDPWAYAQYHCGTAANAYTDVHWSYFPSQQVD